MNAASCHSITSHTTPPSHLPPNTDSYLSIHSDTASLAPLFYCTLPIILLSLTFLLCTISIPLQYLLSLLLPLLHRIDQFVQLLQQAPQLAKGVAIPESVEGVPSCQYHSVPKLLLSSKIATSTVYIQFKQLVWYKS